MYRSIYLDRLDERDNKVMNVFPEIQDIRLDDVEIHGFNEREIEERLDEVKEMIQGESL